MMYRVYVRRVIEGYVIVDAENEADATDQVMESEEDVNAILRIEPMLVQAKEVK